MQQDKNFPVSPAKVWKVAKHVLVNQVRGFEQGSQTEVHLIKSYVQIVLGIPAGMASYSLWASRSSAWDSLSTLPSLQVDIIILTCD